MLLKIQAASHCLGQKVFIATGSKKNSCEVLETAGIYPKKFAFTTYD